MSRITITATSLAFSVSGCAWLREAVPGSTSPDGDAYSRGEAFFTAVAETLGSEGLALGPVALLGVVVSKVAANLLKPEAV